MKQILTLMLCVLLLLTLAACGTEATPDNPDASQPADSNVTYHVTKRLMEHDTGDLNLTEYTYDDHWNILSTKTLLNGEFASSMEYAYSEDMRIVTMTTTSAIYDASTSEIHRTYDESGKLLRAESYSDGSLAGTTVYTYDEEGREIKLEGTDADGNPTTTVEHVYDASGNLIADSTQTSQYSLRHEYAYDSQNRRISTDVYQNGAFATRTEYTWDGNTQTGILYNIENTPLQKTVNVLDDAGNLLVQEVRDILGTLQYRICYEYTGTDGSISSGIPE